MLGIYDGSLVHSRIPNNHVARSSPIFVEKSIEARPYASELRYAQSLALGSFQKLAQPRLNAFESDNVSRNRHDGVSRGKEFLA